LQPFLVTCGSDPGPKKRRMKEGFLRGAAYDDLWKRYHKCQIQYTYGNIGQIQPPLLIVTIKKLPTTQKNGGAMRLALTFKPGVTTPLEFPEANLLFLAAPLVPGPAPEETAAIEAALAAPIGAPRLEDTLHPGMRVVILVDDITRPTPTARIIPHLMGRLAQAGIEPGEVKFILAPGTHRPATADELAQKLGRDVLDRYTVLNRDYRDESKFVSLGATASGVPIELDREVLEADFVIGLGNIIPHISAGWSGGGKIVLPGVCSRRTTDMMHYIACTVQHVLEVLGTTENIPRREIEEVARRAGLSFIVNTVLDEDHRIQGVFAGDPVMAHRAGVQLAERIMVVPIPAQADILVVSANPCHFDYWQGIKPYAYAHRAVRDGGVMIFLLDGGEGLCGDAPSHEPTLRRYMLRDFEEMKMDLEQGSADDIVGMNVPMYHAMLRRRVTNFIVTNHWGADEVNVLGFEARPSAQIALDDAFRLLGSGAKVGIIPYGGETLTRVDPEGYARLRR